MWQTPKTNWRWIDDIQGDFFTHEDYNRIKGNIAFLADYAKEVFLPVEITDMGADKTVTDYPYADEINAISNNLEKIAARIKTVDIGEKTIYEDNGKFIGYQDLNRIESACLNLKNKITNIKRSKYRLSYRFGAWRVRI